ncbi:MAG: transcriptional regulator, partial [Novosphingobium sp.]
ARRGPGGGYYAARPDAAALDRALSGFLRTHPGSFSEALNITSLLFTELVVAAASCQDPSLRADMAALDARLAVADFDHATFEHDFQDLLFKMVAWPLFELLTHVTLHFAERAAPHTVTGSAATTESWREGRRRIIGAIVAGDAELARFEADRSNRRAVLRRL